MIVYITVYILHLQSQDNHYTDQPLFEPDQDLSAQLVQCTFSSTILISSSSILINNINSVVI